MLQQGSLYLLLLWMVAACNPYQKQIPTGMPLQLDNVYVSTNYEHKKITNVLCLPIANPWKDGQISFYQKEMELALLRNFSKFHYFNIHYPIQEIGDLSSIVNLDTGTINCLKLGALGEQYHSQAILQLSITEYRPFPPMRMQLKALLLDASTGERIWSIDHVFDANDANVVNGMRIWWNTQLAGGNPTQRFNTSLINPSFFIDFVFHSTARSYGDVRVKNAIAIEKMQQQLQKEKK